MMKVSNTIKGIGVILSIALPVAFILFGDLFFEIFPQNWIRIVVILLSLSWLPPLIVILSNIGELSLLDIIKLLLRATISTLFLISSIVIGMLPGLIFYFFTIAMIIFSILAVTMVVLWIFKYLLLIGGPNAVKKDDIILYMTLLNFEITYFTILYMITKSKKFGDFSFSEKYESIINPIAKKIEKSLFVAAVDKKK